MLFFRLTHEIFKDDEDADDSFKAKTVPQREPLGSDGEIITAAPRLVSNLDDLLTS